MSYKSMTIYGIYTVFIYYCLYCLHHNLFAYVVCWYWLKQSMEISYLNGINHETLSNSSRAPGLTSGLQGSVNVHRGALLLVPQWQYISSFVFYIVVSYRKKVL